MTPSRWYGIRHLRWWLLRSLLTRKPGLWRYVPNSDGQYLDLVWRGEL